MVAAGFHSDLMPLAMMAERTLVEPMFTLKFVYLGVNSLRFFLILFVITIAQITMAQMAIKE